jgi:NitT/TauT family transport system substrate-binding protein
MRLKTLATLTGIAALLAACNPAPAEAPGDSPAATPIRLQTDWYPQAEHGGFYYALAMGYYKEEGLDVQILPGGLTYMGALRVTEGQADFAMHKLEAILRHIDKGMPLRLVFATLQHDPSGIMVHEDSPVKTFADLTDRPLMAMPGGTWLAFLKQETGMNPRIVPSDKGMERFLAEPGLAQQCMVTSEPYYARTHGVATRVLLLRDTGFDPYHVVYTSRDFAAAHPDAVRAFARASARGWRDYLTKDPSPAYDLIMKANPRQTREQLDYARNLLISGGFAFEPGHPEGFGLFSRTRVDKLDRQLHKLGIVQNPPPADLFCLPEMVAQ